MAILWGRRRLQKRLRNAFAARFCSQSKPTGACDITALTNFADSPQVQTPVFPAGYSITGSLAVAAIEPTAAQASFSNFRSWVATEAPGDWIVSSTTSGGTGVWGGTSMAAPLLAGEAALVRSIAPTLDVVVRTTRSAATVNSAVRLRVDAAAAISIVQRTYGDDIR